MAVNLLGECKKYDMTMAEMLGFVAQFIERNGLSTELTESLYRADAARKLCLTLAAGKRNNLRPIRD